MDCIGGRAVRVARGRSKAALVLMLAGTLAAVSMPVSANQSTGCEVIKNMRKDIARANIGIGDSVAKAAGDSQENGDAGGCISDYGPNLGLGLSSLLGGLGNLKDAACSALDDYLKDNSSRLSASIKAPMDLGSVDLGVGGDGGSFTVREDELALDVDSVFDRIRSEAPEVDRNSGTFDRDLSGGRDIGNNPFVNQNRGRPVQTPGFNPDSGARR